ncbi:HmuY family protein [Pedobacter metabolipauper]|uniref:Heme-binding HmuY-like protein n=1 Tax=Pedobacter metabolipauper TaxID=425513 RepID=A0A4R6SXT8_9SPHI|nr:HmuY family protein [Pedobacter metabolipauper]TDQ09522.1 heme-binding HmuY-like protein [Pedobacter metabolipauper]
MNKLVYILLTGLFLNTAASAQAIRTEKNLDAKTKTSFFNLETGKAVKETEVWDLAFKGTTIKLNSSSKVKVTAQVLKDSSFDKVLKAPATGFKEDTQSTSAIPTGSGNGWYTYDMSTHEIQPIKDRVIIVKTSGGKVIKLDIQSYYLDQDEFGETGFYTFRYAALK